MACVAGAVGADIANGGVVAARVNVVVVLDSRSIRDRREYRR